MERPPGLRGPGEAISSTSRTAPWTTALAGHAPSVISDRVRRLEDGGVLRGYEARLDTRALGHPLLAFAFITERKPTGGLDTGAALARVTGAEEVHKIAGEDCFLVKLRARNPEALAAVLDGEISKIRTVAATRTTIVLRTVTEGPPLSGTAEMGAPGRGPTRHGAR